MPGDRARRVAAADLLEDSGTRDRQHHHARRRVFACEVVEGQAERVAQDQLLERDAGAEPQRARAQPADRPRRDLEHARRDRRRSGARRGRALGEPDRARVARQVRNATRCCTSSGESRRRHVDRLLEVRAVERVGLVEDREHLELRSPRSSPSTATSMPGTYSSTSSGPSAMARMRSAAWHGRHRVVGADHAATAREADRLHHARVADVAGHLGDLLEVLDHPEPGLGHLGRAPARRASTALSRVARHRSGGLCGKPSRSPAAAATTTPWSSTATTASSGAPLVERGDRRRRRRRDRRAARPRPGRPSSSAIAWRSSDPTTTSTPRPVPRPARSRGPGRSRSGSRRRTRGTVLSWRA